MSVLSKVKRKLEKKPPTRTTICTTPRFLMKNKGKAPIKRQKGEKQKGEKRPQAAAAVQQQQGEKKTRGQELKGRKKTQKDNRSEKKKLSPKTASNSPGAKLKK